MLSDHCLSCLSVCLSVCLCLSVTFVYCSQTAEWIRMKLGVQVGLGSGHIALDGDPAAPIPKGHSSPSFWPMSVVAKRLDGSRFHLVWRPHCARWKPNSTSPKKGHRPLFSAHVCCGQIPRWIKMPLGMEVGLGPGHNVLDGNLASPPQRGTAPIFGPYLLWPNGWLDQGAT